MIQLNVLTCFGATTLSYDEKVTHSHASSLSLSYNQQRWPPRIYHATMATPVPMSSASPTLTPNSDLPSRVITILTEKSPTQLALYACAFGTGKFLLYSLNKISSHLYGQLISRISYSTSSYCTHDFCPRCARSQDRSLSH
jgi:hypothetical protein